MERGDLGIKAEVIRQALSVSVEAHTNPEGLPFVVRGIENSPSQVVVAFAGSWSPNHWFAGDSEAKPFGETDVNPKKFPSLRSIGKDAVAKVNGAFMERFLHILDEGSQTFRAEVTKAVENDKQIIFGGHSSAGPIAIYATVWFLEEYVRSKEKQTSRPLCLTFASPLTTDRTFCHAVQREGWSNCFVHFVTKLDIVPRILLAPRSSATELLQGIVSFSDPKYEPASIDNLTSLFVNVMKSASCVANHAACELMGSKHTIFDTMSGFIKRSPYRPCGKYVFRTETGVLVVVENQDAVLQLLFYSLQIESETELQNMAEASLRAHWTCKDELDASLAAPNVVCLKKLRELPLSSNHDARNDLNLCASARLCLRAAGELEKKKLDNLERINGKKGDIEKALESLEKYRTANKDRNVGYYDAFKLQEEEEDFKANVKRLELAAIWDDIVEMLRHEQLPDGFEADKKWVDLGTRFRRLVEPIDIANYYRHSRDDVAGHYMERRSRPSRYKYTQRWREHAEQLPKDSCGESCFWAEVEKLKVEVAKKQWDEIENEVLDLETRLEDWYNKDKEDKSDMFLRKSTLVEWWQTLRADHKLKSCIKKFMPS
ncbi:protein EDS1L-like isoform X3 [Rhodamnia argentea]|uniref:Protein EDS1L-like isoform X3 n=1 Tax=Rhodamnia argentea TaxID=178133 RepID=A0A8B8NGB2_9MYRT|nr:protein EDS1L-like isoform X3 [Rhodamnia argentea]